MTAPSIDTMPRPALEAPVILRLRNWKFLKLPQVSEPNWMALFSVDWMVESRTTLFSLRNVLDGDAVELHPVAAVGDDREVTGLPERHVGDVDVPAELERQHLVALARRDVLAGLQLAGAVDHALAGEVDVLDVLAPQQRVAEVAVPEVLVLGVRVGLRRVDAAAGRHDPRALLDVDGDVALEVDRAGQVRARRDLDCAVPGLARRGDGLVDGDRVDRLAVALRAVVLDVEAGRLRHAHRCHDHR
jgi:hypothetical protein